MAVHYFNHLEPIPLEDLTPGKKYSLHCSHSEYCDWISKEGLYATKIVTFKGRGGDGRLMFSDTCGIDGYSFFLKDFYGSRYMLRYT